MAPNDALDVISAINAGLGGAVGGEPVPDDGQVSNASAAGIDELLALLAFDLATQPRRGSEARRGQGSTLEEPQKKDQRAIASHYFQGRGA